MRFYRTKLFLYLIFFLGIGTVSGQQFHGGITAGVVGSQVAGDGYSGFHKGGILQEGMLIGNLQHIQRCSLN